MVIWKVVGRGTRERECLRLAEEDSAGGMAGRQNWSSCVVVLVLSE